MMSLPTCPITNKPTDEPRESGAGGGILSLCGFEQVPNPNNWASVSPIQTEASCQLPAPHRSKPGVTAPAQHRPLVENQSQSTKATLILALRWVSHPGGCPRPCCSNHPSIDESHDSASRG